MSNFVATIPKEAAPHFEAMRIETTARNEADMRHMLWCMLGKRASTDALIEPAPQPVGEDAKASYEVELVALDLRNYIVTIVDAGQELHLPIGKLVNRIDLVSRMSHDDALQIGSFHGAYTERRVRRNLAQADAR